MTEQSNNTQIVAAEPFNLAHLDQSRVKDQSTDLALIKQKAQLLFDSGMLPKALDTWQKVAVVMLKGRELSLPDLVALQHISVVHGTPQLDGQITLALLERSGLMENFAIEEMSNESCTLLVKRHGRQAMRYACKREHAAGLRMKEGDQWKSLVETQQWVMQPRTKLFYFTVKEMARRIFSDVLNGMAGNWQGDVVITGDFADGEFYETEDGDAGVIAPLSESPSAEVETPAEDGELVEQVEEAEFEPVEPAAIGSLDMNSLLNRAMRGGLVKHPAHFDNLIRKMKTDGEIKDSMTADQVLDAMRKHKAQKEMVSE